jgi:hypothetical protein
MGYAHIQNLYRPEAQGILLFKEVYAMEKVHGTSAHVSYRRDQAGPATIDGSPSRLTFFSGGEKHSNFVDFFLKNGPTPADLQAKADAALSTPIWTVYGEAYGGRCQGMSATYGPDLRFIAFDVQIDEKWLSVPDAEKFCLDLGIEFVPYRKVSTDIAVLDAERDRPSRVAFLRGIAEPKKSEGVVLRPLVELSSNWGRICAKHKAAEFSERATTPKVIDGEKLAVLQGAQAIADEWVTEERLTHVIDHLKAAQGGLSSRGFGVQDTGTIIKVMVEDVYREASGEVVESKEATAAIGKKTAQMFKARVTTIVSAGSRPFPE